jgi:hypothetical protein
MNGAADRLDRHVLAGIRAAELLHRGDGLTVTLGRSSELPHGLRQRALRRGLAIRRPLDLFIYPL